MNEGITLQEMADMVESSLTIDFNETDIDINKEDMKKWVSANSRGNTDTYLDFVLEKAKDVAISTMPWKLLNKKIKQVLQDEKIWKQPKKVEA